MEDVDNENDKRNKSRSPSPGIKSTAVVKYTAYQTPVGYARLQCNTDLNMPPSNWGAAIDSYGLKEILTGGTGLSSFRMAHMFPDCVGDVDVISGAECIKKLLKLPYQPNGTVSMIVHRVENTLLLDDFDVYGYLMKSEWSWLKDFFYENILKTMSEQERMTLRLAPAPSAALTHKFLSHSVAARPPPPQPLPDPRAPVCLPGPFLPEPETKEAKPEEPPNDHLFNRNVLWTFEDIHMLIGSDLPIFGDKDRPCVSLRLRDAREPINVLTGIDYWLDNLMCNVPEVLMCYHLDGIVQKYEPMKTEDLPNMENSKFSPKVIRNVAQNILSFLKSNATKAGHTYWLFKGPHDDVVKLYDLTSLCPDSLDNPFTTPVAMLLYRVARNMRMTNRSKHVRQLLEHVIELLKVERYPQILASSHYMLADLYVPATTNPACPDFKDESEDSDGEETDYVGGDFASEDNLYTDNSTVQVGKRHNDGAEDEDRNRIQVAERIEDGARTPDGEKAEDKGRVEDGDRNRIQVAERIEDGARTPDGEKAEDKGRVEDGDRNRIQVAERIEDGVRTPDGEKAEDKGRVEDGDRAENKEIMEDEDEDGAEDKEIIEDGDSALALQIRGLMLRDNGDRGRDGDGDRIGSRKRKPVRGKGLGVAAPGRCGRALAHALKGLLALHNVTIHKCKEEERDRIKQQIIIEEQHPKMANPYEPIKMNYEPITKVKVDGQHTSRSRRRKRDRKPSEKTLIDPNIDKNAIQILKEKKLYPTWHEPNRDDNFAWKLHLKTLLYEKICLAYATLAEYSYSNEQYGFSLKYIDMATKCQKLLCNMIIRSKVVDAGCLIGRVGDNYFQLSKHWHRLGQFKKQYETDHDIDAKIRLEIDNDMAEEVDGEVAADFDLDICLPASEVSAMLLSCAHYRRAAAAAPGKRGELLRRLASVGNELAVRYMNDAQQMYMKYQEEADHTDPKAQLLKKQFTAISRKSLECLDEATDIFKQVNDLPNLALLYCNKGRYLRFKAHCDEGGFSVEKRRLYSEAEELYHAALRLLGARGHSAAAVRQLAAWELSCHAYTRAALLQDTGAGEVTEVAEALKHALKYCLLSPGPRQYLYQFRAAMIYHRLGSLYHSQYRITHEDGPKRRTLLNATRANYEQAANMFASLEDAAMFLTAQLEHVAALEAQASVSPNLKLKSLQTAIQLLRQCHSIMKLLKDKDPDEQKETPKPEDNDEKTMKNEHSLLSLYENRLHYILKSIIQYCRSKSNKDYERITDLHKKLYCASLKITRVDDVRLYAASVCEALASMDEISKDFE